MYILNTRIYPFREYNKHSFSDFGIITEAQMAYLLEKTKTKSPELLMHKINNAFHNDKLKRQVVTSIIKVSATRSFPFLKITKTAAS